MQFNVMIKLSPNKGMDWRVELIASVMVRLIHALSAIASMFKFLRNGWATKTSTIFDTPWLLVTPLAWSKTTREIKLMGTMIKTSVRRTQNTPANELPNRGLILRNKGLTK
jgi:hypothetical protein